VLGAGKTATRKKGFALVLLCLISLMAVLDTTIVALALPSMRRDLGFSSADAQWILNGYALVFGGLLLLLGRCGNLYGRRRLLMSGLALFALASLLGGLAWEPWVLVAARCAQGAGAAVLVPASLSLVTTVFAEGEERDRAVGVYGAMGSLGFICGMMLGGLLTEFLGWRWVLFVNVPVALTVLLLAPTSIPESRDEDAPRTLDVPGAATATLGFASLIYAISEAPSNGWASRQTLRLAGVGALLVGGFVVAESRSKAPLASLNVLRARAVAIPNAAALLSSCVGISQLFLLTLYFQDTLGLRPTEAGLLFGPMALAGLACSPLAGRATTRFGAKSVAAAGFVVTAAGLLLMARMPVGGIPTVVLVGTVVAEAGLMFSNVSLTIATTGGVDEGKRGLAAGLLNTSVQLGNAWGLGLITAVVAAATAALGREAAGAAAAGLRWGMLATVGFAVVALPIVTLGLPKGRPSGEESGGAGVRTPPKTETEVGARKREVRS
jgi:EmrB/QacA subfamily drug resistance transporter